MKTYKNVVDIINEKDVFIFDSDGVVADSVSIKSKAFAELYSSYDIDIVNKIVDYHIENGGVSRFDKIKYYQKNIIGQNITDKELKFLANKFSKLVFDKIVDCPSIEGVEDFLEYYCTGRKKCYINTATPLEEIIRILKEREQIYFFSGIYGYTKSKSENLRCIADQYSVASMVFFGDADTDLDASDNVGVDFIEVGDGHVVRKRKDCYHVHNFNNLC